MSMYVYAFYLQQQQYHDPPTLYTSPNALTSSARTPLVIAPCYHYR